MVRRIALIASATGAAAIFGVAVASAALVTYFGPAFISPGLPKTKGGSIVTQTQNFMGKNSGSGNQCKVRFDKLGRIDNRRNDNPGDVQFRDRRPLDRLRRRSTCLRGRIPERRIQRHLLIRSVIRCSQDSAAARRMRRSEGSGS